jgi:transcriptional regulator with PAS, ATPase and Fis domain
VISSKEDRIEESDVYRALSRNPYGGEDSRDDRVFREGDGGLAHVVTQFERRLIEDALKRWKSTRKAAAHLGISQSQLMRKKQKYNIRTE